VFQWLITFLVVEITPPAIQNIGWKTYIIFAIFNWVSIVIAWLWFPETAGRTLESVDFMFAGAGSLREVVKRSLRKEANEFGEMGTDKPRAQTPDNDSKDEVEQLESVNPGDTKVV
jgi:hypothetical protein